MEKVISETIFAIKEAEEAFAVIIGAVGSGKTLALRMMIDSLKPDKYKVVIISNPGISFTQLLKDIIGQITGQPCEEGRKNALLEVFRRLLFTTLNEGRKIIIFIDEANTLSPANLENLRLLTNMQDDQRNLFTLVLAGQIELAERLEHPKRANLFQRIGTYGRIDKLPSEEAVKAYVETRLKLAGTQIKIFSDECIPIIWEYSEQGVPRLINKICKLCLIAGETGNSDYISSDVVLEIAERFQKLSKSAVQKRKPRSRPGDDVVFSDAILPDPEPEGSFPADPFLYKETQHEDVEPILEAASGPESQGTSLPTGISMADSAAQESPPTVPWPIPQMKPETDDQSVSEAGTDQPTENKISEPRLQTTIDREKDIPAMSALPSFEGTIEKHFPEETLPLTINAIQPELPDAPLPGNMADAETLISRVKPSTAETSEVKIKQDYIEDQNQHPSEQEKYDEVIIGEHRISLAIPKDILKQVKTFNRESVNKSAGFWAAQIIKKNPQLTSSPLSDPVYIWNEIKDSILKRIAV
ncbi:MAG: AAA family ATPase [Deltaproteobacteria bacterium]